MEAQRRKVTHLNSVIDKTEIKTEIYSTLKPPFPWIDTPPPAKQKQNKTKRSTKPSNLVGVTKEMDDEKWIESGNLCDCVMTSFLFCGP